MGRLVCVSNRIPLGADPSGGLVVALGDVLAGSDGVWIGAAGGPVETPARSLTPIEGGPFRRLSFDLTEAELAGYYAGYANAVLWPILHGRADLMAISGEALSVYKAVNRRIARMLMPELRPDDLVWVHDFHLFPLAHELRVLGARNRIGFFLHTPFPAPFDMAALPNGLELCHWLMRYDLVGLQGTRDVRKFRASLRALAEADTGPEPGATSGLDEDAAEDDGVIRLAGNVARVAAFPIAIDTAEFAALAEAEHGRLPPGIVKPDRALMIGVDRLDYSKGIPQRFRSFDTFLDRHPDMHRHVSLLQIAPPTREGVEAYDAIRAETEALAGRINGAHADLGWAPIRYIHRHVARETLAGLFRAARVGLVTPLMDGMNLVAKEYVAAQDPADPGVLVLSQFAGAAEQMEDALIVNPHDIEQVAGAMLTALTMAPGERRKRHEQLLEGLEARDVHWWAQAFLDALRDRPAAAA